MLRVVACILALAMTGGTVPSAEAPAAVKPPWQRYLQGDDAKQAAELDGRIVAAQQAGKWEEAVRAAEELLELRQKKQGNDHWQAVHAHWLVAALRAAQRQTKEVQQEYITLPGLERESQTVSMVQLAPTPPRRA
jgi:hypothetical protein